MADKNVLCYDKILGVYYSTNMEEISRAQKRLDELLSCRGYFSLDQYMDILTKDWPEDLREQFYEDRCKGWMRDYGYLQKVGDVKFDFELQYEKSDDCSDLISINFLPKEKEE